MTDPLFSALGDIPARWRRDDPDATALITPTTTLTAATLATLVDRQVAGLRATTPPGARVAVHAENTASYVALLYAAPTAGRTLVPLNTRLGHDALASQLARTDTALLLGDPVPGFDGPTLPLGELPGSTRPGSPESHRDPHDVAWIIFTSGSTGRPKGVLLTHASLAAAVAGTAAARPLADDEVYAYPFPLFHVAAYNVVHAHGRRRPVVLPRRFDAAELIRMCHDHRVTAVSLAATMLRMLLDALAGHPDLTPPPTLRTIAYGAAPMPAGLLREAHDVLGCDFAQGYGMTELSGNAVFLPPDAHRRGLAGETSLLTAAGWASPGVDVRIVDDQGEPVGPDEPGEVTIRADQVCAGYLDDETATNAAIRDGRLHTGDIGTLDATGLLRIVDRAKDIVVTGGENVASREVEDVLRAHPSVADVAVVGLPDDRWGEAVTAVVVTRDRFTGAPDTILPAPPTVAEALRRHVGDRLAGYKKPKRVFLTAALPVNASGKPDKPTLRTRLSRIDPSDGNRGRHADPPGRPPGNDDGKPPKPA